MEKLLFINACVREESRTYWLAQQWLAQWKGSLEKIDLYAKAPLPLDRAALAARIALCEGGAYDDPIFAYARQFTQADVILIAAPYWDLSFPACLKAYLEAINICGITFDYTAQGEAYSLCRAHKLVYITTAGGQILSPELGYGYIRALAQAFWGIDDTAYYAAENLDIEGADTQAILDNTAREIMKGRACVRPPA